MMSESVGCAEQISAGDMPVILIVLNDQGGQLWTGTTKKSRQH